MATAPVQNIPVVDIETDYKEISRKDARVVFDFDRWAAHRSTSRYARHIFGLPASRLMRGLSGPLLYVMGVASAVCAYEYARQTGVLPETLPDFLLRSKEPFALTSFALSLLLVFRTNASYERWDGARKMWGLVLNRSRDITRQGLAWIPNDRPEMKDMLCRWVPAFSKALMCHLRPGEDAAKELAGVGLLPHEVEACLKSTHRPNYVMQVLASIIRSSQVPIAAALAMEANITAYEDCLGGCERILRTPIPLFYTRHTSRFLMIWLTLLPFTLYDTCGWTTIPLAGTIAFLLLGVEEIGVAIEEPFTVLALEAISNTAYVNVKELQAMHERGTLPNGDQEDLGAQRMVALSYPAAAAASGSSGPPRLEASRNGARV
ncbi:hypothetical protein N2152v2_006044 [Parachlorella kessleri]